MRLRKVVQALAILVLVLGAMLWGYQHYGPGTGLIIPDKEKKAGPAGVAKRRPAPALVITKKSLNGKKELSSPSVANGAEKRDFDHPLSNKGKISFPPGAVRNEVTLRFPSYKAMMDFIKRAKERGIRVLGVIGELNTVRVVLLEGDKPAEVFGPVEEDTRVEFNFPVSRPMPPREKTMLGNSGFGSEALSWLGVPEDNSTWGEGVKVAVLDTAVREHQALEEAKLERLRLVDPYSGGEGASHGAAVVGIIAGQGQGAQGIAPATDILSIEVLNAKGEGNSFTVAQGILEAVDRGAQIISLSLGTYGDSRVLREAVQYAKEKGVLLVAASGNESRGDLPYPARYDGVLAVTSIDANGLAAGFVNTGAEVDLAAPGVGVMTVGGNDRFVHASGTSFSVPFVAGALAAVMSLEPDLSTQEAAEVILSNSNDAGMPEQDSVFGAGILNMDRILNRDSRGIYDAALADQVVDTANVEQGVIPLVVSVQNRGTERLQSVELEVVLGRQRRTFALGTLDPGEVGSAQVSLNPVLLRNPQGVLLESSVRAAYDSNPSNDRKSTVIRMLEGG